MLDDGGAVVALDVGDRVRAALVADQQAVAVREVARALRLAVHRDLAAIGRVRLRPAAMPLAMIFDFVLRPRWIIFVPLSTCCKPFDTAIE